MEGEEGSHGEYTVSGSLSLFSQNVAFESLNFERRGLRIRIKDDYCTPSSYLLDIVGGGVVSDTV